MRSLKPIVWMPLLAAASLFASDWDRGKAFEFLELRQRQWAEWKPAQKPGGPCFACHTGLSYALARRAAGEKQLRPLERDLVKAVQARLAANPPNKAYVLAGAEAVLNAVVLSLRRNRAEAPLDSADRAALADLWRTQFREGPAAGSWEWFNYNLDPADSEHSGYLGATLAELALSVYPPQPSERVDTLRAFLQREFSKQPLHNRLARIAFSPVSDGGTKAGVLQELWSAQSGDGGWTTAALGPWAAHPDAPPDSGSNAYATAWAAYAVRQSGVACSDTRLQKALAWLIRRQDRTTGAWKSPSMNQVYPKGSIQEGFMTDAATGFAAAALLSCAPSATH